VVDPGVGSGQDEPVVLDLDGRLLVGPENGLFDIAARRASRTSCRRIRWQPAELSRTFHGRDLYGPVCAMLASGDVPDLEAVAWRDRHGWPDDTPEIVYIDRFGNCMTGMRSGSIAPGTVLARGGRRIRYAETFAKAPPAEPFWYGNSIGLVEIAVNGGSAADMLRLKIGSTLRR
jgi:S-adenosylmethionine hydrolase